MRGEAFWQGYDARLIGEPQDACPYPADTPKAAEWLEGWSENMVAFLAEETKTSS